MSCGIGCLSSTHFNASNDGEFPVGQIVEIDMNGQACDCFVQNSHMRLELPEGIDEEDWIIPAILTRPISCTVPFYLDELSDSRM